LARYSANIEIMMRAARAAARHLVRDFGEVEHLQVSIKGPGDFVSAADRRAERIIKDELQRARPDWGLLLEESGRIEGASKLNRWIVDPLDGTSNFLHAIPHFAISIALEQAGEIVAGLVYDPIKEELFVAERGNGAFLNDRRIRVSKRSELDRSLIACGFPVQGWRGREKGFARQLDLVSDRVAGIRRFGACALDLAWIAAGRQDGYWEYGVYPWDFAAGMLLVREAGGRLGRLEGDEDLWSEGTIVAGNPEIYEKLRGLLVEVTPGAALR
jgi:myo-inositol-1(or 4)-monophosphatase